MNLIILFDYFWSDFDSDNNENIVWNSLSKLFELESLKLGIVESELNIIDSSFNFSLVES